MDRECAVQQRRSERWASLDLDREFECRISGRRVETPRCAMLLTMREQTASGGQERARGTRRARLRMRKSRGAAEIEQAQALIALWPGAHKLGGCDSYEGSNQCDDAENKRCPV